MLSLFGEKMLFRFPFVFCLPYLPNMALPYMAKPYKAKPYVAMPDMAKPYMAMPAAAGGRRERKREMNLFQTLYH